MNQVTKKNLIFLFSILSLTFFDILTKYLVFGMEKTSYLLFTINPSINYGSAFSLFSSINIYPLIVSFLSICVISYLIYLYLKQKKISNIEYLFFILTISGILGNLFDRVFFGFVRDFIEISFFPAIFNIADIYLSLSFILILILVKKKSVSD